MASKYDWSLVAASNATSDSAINWAEGQAPSTVNGSARQMMARDAELLGDIGGALTAGGTADALTVTANSAFTTYANGRIITLRIATDNTTAATLNVNGIGAKSIRKMISSGESALTGGELQATGIYDFKYSEALNSAAGGWLLLNPTLADQSAYVTLTGTQTLTNKTLTTPQINDTSADHQYVLAVSELAADRTVTLPLLTGNDEFVFKDHTQTLTNKTLTSPVINGLDASLTAKGIIEIATAAEYRTGTDAARALTPGQVFDAAATVTLTDAATIAVDMSTFINAVVTLGGNRTLGSPTNEKPGQTGRIRIVQDGTGSRTLAYGTDWEFAGGTAPVLSTAAGAEDILYYDVLASNRVFASLVKAVA
ncbi:hypothetical protein [Mesorhizobium wenxiniae]|uniref:Uncharacterized protein n=1 Tax=Mesorhizobium wenxiniae TaxID=2014805 RepID=A0A271KG28_9HYPH|nr:hypothetical protein [Mesorhizobium wenxiniae]PAP93985.1 hypothetical protein CIT31_16595 [Mesorhizobium wenxiniae]